MKRLVLAVAVVLISVVASGCAVGNPKPTTYISDTGATLNADVYSSFVGDTEFWWRYGETTAYGIETPHRTVAIADDQPHPVSQPISGLTADTTYHFQICVQDEEEDPPRVVCNKDQTFTTAPAAAARGSPSRPSATATTRSTSMDADGGNQTNLTNDAGDDDDPAWSPDGSKIAFASDRDGNHEIYVMDADGGNQTNLTNNPGVRRDSGLVAGRQQDRLHHQPRRQRRDLRDGRRRRQPDQPHQRRRATTSIRPGRRTAPRSPSPPTATATTRST